MTTFNYKYQYYVWFMDDTALTYPSNNPFWAAHPNWNTYDAAGPRVGEVWRQGPKGGVKIIQDNTGCGRYGYATKDSEAMKEFMWIKLAAKEL